MLYHPNEEFSENDAIFPVPGKPAILKRGNLIMERCLQADKIFPVPRKPAILKGGNLTVKQGLQACVSDSPFLPKIRSSTSGRATRSNTAFWEEYSSNTCSNLYWYWKTPRIKNALHPLKLTGNKSHRHHATDLLISPKTGQHSLISPKTGQHSLISPKTGQHSLISPKQNTH